MLGSSLNPTFKFLKTKIYGHGAMVAYRSPKPLILVRIQAPVQTVYTNYE
jgi:hypothetical protein